jgi:AraC family transcriptional regulator
MHPPASALANRDHARRVIDGTRRPGVVPPAWRTPLAAGHRGADLHVRQHKTFAHATAIIKDIQGTAGSYSGSAHGPCAQLTMRLAHAGGPIRFAETPAKAIMAPRTCGEAVHFVPADMPIFAYSENMRHMRYVALQFDPVTALVAGEDAVNPLALVTPRLTFVDQRLLGLARLIEIELTSDRPTNPLYGDSIFLAMLVALSDAFEGPRPPQRRGGLALWQLRRVTDYIEDRLAARIELGELCSIAGLSQAYFCRAFKASTGLAPHQWQMEARLRRARHLLLTSRTSIAEIALDIGFADQAHFTRAFTRAVGTSPGAWRRTHQT